jgi:ATP-binding cassette, subfamily C (CFTR/MRP), member 1
LCLRRISFNCRPGEVVAVVGGVGCSKSTLLGALLGEVTCLSGQVEVNGRLAYYSQSPFIINASVRDNILFGHVNEPVDEARYQRTLDCCALRRDLELLPNGEHTEIGERGITLSGGQKARVALARVVYHQADVSLVDDPLSAVDAHVGKVIFEEAIVGDLMEPTGGQQRCVVLVTNALEYLKHPKVSRIVVLGEGRVVEVGSFLELARKKDSRFAQFLSVLADSGSGAVSSCPTSPESSKKILSASLPIVADTESKPTKGLMTEEVRKHGHVGMEAYFALAQAAGHKWLVPFSVLLGFGAAEFIQFLGNWWLTFWSSHGHEYSQFYLLSVYALINCAYALASLFRMLFVTFLGYRASRQLFSKMLSVVLEAPMAFFDTTPIGRLLNRFSKGKSASEASDGAVAKDPT